MRDYREFWEPSVAQTSTKINSRTEKKYFNKLFVTVSEFENGNICFTDDIKEQIFGNEHLQNRLIKELALQIKTLFKKYGVKNSDLVLVAGIGNEHITADSLGCSTCDGLFVTARFFKDKGFNEKFGNLATVKCGVGGITGIDSYVHLVSLCEKLKPAAIIAVDTLAANTTKRLASSVQISDCGLTPGKGVGNGKTEFSGATLPCPVIAVGVPLVIYVNKILAEYYDEQNASPTPSLSCLQNLIVTTKDVDFAVKDFAKILSAGINKAVHDGDEE